MNVLTKDQETAYELLSSHIMSNPEHVLVVSKQGDQVRVSFHSRDIDKIIALLKYAEIEIIKKLDTLPREDLDEC